MSNFVVNPYQFAPALDYPDSIGSDGDATTVSGVTLNTSNEILGTGCFSFDGTNDYCILPNNLDTMLDGGAFSFSCWANVASTTASFKTVISKMANPTWSNPYHAFSIEQTGTNTLTFGTNDGGTTEKGVNHTFSGTGWKNLVVTKTADDLFSFYINDDTATTLNSASGSSNT